MKITVYNHTSSNEHIDRFVEKILDSNLTFFASELLAYGFNQPGELSNAIERAIQICKASDISIRSNFRPVYRSNTNTTICDWKLSALARKLIVLNGHASNPLVAKTQIMLLEGNPI